MDPAPAPATPTALAALERALADVARILADRATVDDLARRSGFDLPAASWALLEYLDGHGPMPVSAVAACHGVDVSSVTPRIKRLERDGLISRRREPRDARIHLIHITDRGRHALDSVHAARRDLLDTAIAELDPTHVGIAAGVLELIAGRLSTTRRRIDAQSPGGASPHPLGLGPEDDPRDLPPTSAEADRARRPGERSESIPT